MASLKIQESEIPPLTGMTAIITGERPIRCVSLVECGYVA